MGKMCGGSFRNSVFQINRKSINLYSNQKLRNIFNTDICLPSMSTMSFLLDYKLHRSNRILERKFTSCFKNKLFLITLKFLWYDSNMAKFFN